MPTRSPHNDPRLHVSSPLVLDSQVSAAALLKIVVRSSYAEVFF